MKKQTENGFTLIELVITIIALIIVIGVLGNALFNMFNHHSNVELLRLDQHNIRMAALAITRQVRHGVEDHTFDVYINGAGELVLRAITPTPAGSPIIHASIRYSIDSNGTLVRYVDGITPLPFIPVDLQSFVVQIMDVNDDGDFVPYAAGNWLSMILTGTQGAYIETTISIDRIVG